VRWKGWCANAHTDKRYRYTTIEHLWLWVLVPVYVWGKGIEGTMTKVIERIEARYDIQEAEFGTVYRWHPKSVLVECGCGETTALTASKSTCEECGTEHEGFVWEDGTEHLPQAERDKVVHPWRYYYSEDRKEDGGLPY
jgi:hypothetical protein